MKYDFKYQSGARSFDPGFGMSIVVKDDDFERGYSQGYTEGEQAGYGNGVTEGVEQGKQAEYDRFWDLYQSNGTRTAYNYAFYAWNNACFKPKYKPIKPSGTGAHNMFQYSGVTVIDKTVLDLTAVNSLSGTFASGKMTQIEIDIPNATSIANAFYYLSNLVTLKIENIRENCTIGNFMMANALVNVEVTGTIGTDINLSGSSLLSNESVQNVIDHLKDLTGATAKTLTFHKTVGNKLTEAQKATITAKNWTLVY